MSEKFKARVRGFLAGELAAAPGIEIPVAAGVDLAALTAGDDSADKFVYLRVGKAGELTENKRRWSEKALGRIVEALPLFSLKGHEQAKPGESMPYRDFSTAWVGGKMVNGELYVKGYVPKDETVLKERIRVARAVGRSVAVSPWGTLYTSRNAAGEIMVEDFRPERIDYGTPGTAGFPSAEVLAVGGELQDETNQEERMDELQKLQKRVEELGEELATQKATLATVTKERDALKAQVETLGGELKTFKDASAAATKAAYDAKRKELVDSLPEQVREVGGELLAGTTVVDLDANFPKVKEKLAKLNPGLRIIGGETRREEQRDEDFAGD